MDPFTQAWIVWGGMFLAIEGAAVFNKRKSDTLSEHVWAWFSIKSKGRGWLYRRAALGGFLAWLTIHFMTGA